VIAVMEREMAYTADVNRWRGPTEESYRPPHMLDSPWHPGWIAATVLGFSFLFLVMFLEWYFLHRWHESARAPEAE